MKRLFMIMILGGFVLSAQAQDTTPYVFSNEKDNAYTEVKDQHQTGTCWSFATLSFIESEILRLGKGSHNISEMYNVRMTYPKKAAMYVRYQGKHQFGPGSLSHDAMTVVKEYGMLPEEVYEGLNYGKDAHNHGEMDAILEGMMTRLVKSGTGDFSTAWLPAVEAVLDAYLGEVPEEFEYQGKKYTAASFRDKMGIKPNDYISITSFSHHPFYAAFVLEVPDNFSQQAFMNVPLADLMAIVDNAIDQGYTIAWDADVSEPGFSFRQGLAILPADDVEREAVFKEVVKEQSVTQASRQAAFDSQATTDDHLMHIVGSATDQNGQKYYIIKNSWGDENLYGGKQYVSAAYFQMKTIGIMLHKDGLPKAVKKKMDL